MRSSRITTGAAKLYHSLSRLHNALPYRYVRSGWALPAWHYFFEVTRRCNLRCKMCMFRDWFTQNPVHELMEGELSAEEWKGVIDETGPLSVLTFTGGEVWVRADFPDIVEHACTKRRAHIITNGILMDEERARLCLGLAPRRPFGAGLYFVGTSVDGPEAIHNAIRGRDDAFERTQENIARLTHLRDQRKQRFPLVHMTAVIMEANLDALCELPAIARSMGAEVLNLTREYTYADYNAQTSTPESLRAAHADPPRLDPERLRKQLEATEEAARKAGVELRLPSMPRSGLIGYYEGRLDVARYSCRAVWTMLNVSSQGDVCPCLIHRVGNVREARLKDLWNGEAMRKFRRAVREEPFCFCKGCCHLEYDPGCRRLAP